MCVRTRVEVYSRCASLLYKARCCGNFFFHCWTFWSHIFVLWKPFVFAIKESLTSSPPVLTAPKMKPLLTRNNSFCLRSKQDMQAFNLGYVYSYDFLFFFPSSSSFFQRSNRCFVSRLQDSGAGNLSERKYNEVSQEVVIDNNKANLELLIQAFFYTKVIFSAYSVSSTYWHSHQERIKCDNPIVWLSESTWNNRYFLLG